MRVDRLMLYSSLGITCEPCERHVRIGYKFILVKPGNNVNLDIGSDIESFEKTMGYSLLHKGFGSKEDFLETYCSGQSPSVLNRRELNKVLELMLSKNDRILSIGSGIGEHDVLLHLSGYKIVASDIIPGVLEKTRKLFPDLETMTFDILNPKSSLKYDCILDTGLSYLYNYMEAIRIFSNCNRLLNPSGKLVFVLRYRDNLFTRFMDDFVLPLEARIVNLALAVRRSNLRLLRRKHGYRRSMSEILELGKMTGFELQKIGYAGYGVEAMGSIILTHIHIPSLSQILATLDKKIHIMNSATVFSFRKVREVK